ncbi:MAG: 6-bladed beta-propeller [Acidobacteria bacterium]|jgi:hypothetical protein|nr:6-bladed beta-propeller [Acidobacteriota bacterium]
MKKQFLLIVLVLIASLVFASKTVELKNLQNPHQILVDNNQVFIADIPTVLIYSLDNFNLLKSFGKKGEGPGEYGGIGYIVINIDQKYLYVSSKGKICYYNRQGDYLMEKKKGMAGSYTPVGQNFVAYGLAFNREEQIALETIDLFDSNLAKIKTLYIEPSWMQQSGPYNGINLLNYAGLRFKVSAEKIFLRGEKGTIKVFNEKGENLYSIDPQYEKIKVTETDKNQYLDYMKYDTFFRDRLEYFKSRVRFNDFFPEVRYFDIADQKIYIFTYKKRGDNTQCLAYDLDGKFIKELYLPIRSLNPTTLAPISIEKGKLYQLIENEEKEEWEISITDIK